MVTLPTTPTGHDLESYFAALLQSTGHYVETNIKDKNILELDIVATDYRRKAARPRLFEVKGAAARLEDIFKLIGHMTYLGVDEGAYVTTSAPKDRDVEWFERVCDRTNVAFIMLPNLSEAAAIFDARGFGRAREPRHSVWRFSYWLERIYLRAVRELRPTSLVARAAVDYYNLVNSGVFLTADHLEKVGKVYAAYQEHPGLAREFADEIGDGRRGEVIMNQALRTGRHLPVQAAMYFEHRARLSLLKAATDYLLSSIKLEASRSDDIVVDFGLVGLPRTFLRGLTWLERQKKYWLFPLFWQNFLWGWGGMLPDEHRDDVLADIAEASGLSAPEAATALEAFDQLFPIDSGWLKHFENADYEFVALTPFHFQGLGAFHQLKQAGFEDYSGWLTTGQYTAKDFAKRNNAAVKVMEEASAIPSGA